MEILCVVARTSSDDKFNALLAPSINKFKLKCVQIGDKPNEDGVVFSKSVVEKYHIGCEILKQQNIITDETIFVFVHEDVNLVDNLFIEKINYVFDERKDIGVVGVVGVEKISETGWWLSPENNPVGHQVISTVDGVAGSGEYVKYGPVGFYDKVVAVDNSIFAVRGSVLKDGIDFDVDTLKSDVNMYAMDFCVNALQRGFKIAVADILTFHHSRRNTNINPQWEASKLEFNKKYTHIGFPIDVDKFKFDESEVVDVEI